MVAMAAAHSRSGARRRQPLCSMDVQSTVRLLLLVAALSGGQVAAQRHNKKPPLPSSCDAPHSDGRADSDAGGRDSMLLARDYGHSHSGPFSSSHPLAGVRALHQRRDRHMARASAAGTSAPAALQSCAAPQSPWPQAYAKQWQTLVDVYDALGGHGWHPWNRANWSSHSVSFCCWGQEAPPNPDGSGGPVITCSSLGSGVAADVAVTGLELAHDPGVAGTLPPALFRLESLTSLGIEACGLTGSIPAAIGRLRNLTALGIDQNPRLRGTIPDELFTGCTRLAWLVLYGNSLTGSISSTVGTLTHLTDLALYSNTDLGGTIPEALYSGCSQLETAYLWNTSLSGTISSSVGQLGQLTELFLDNTGITGSIPEELYTGCVLLTKLSLAMLPTSAGHVTGTISRSVGNLAQLTQLLLPLNALTGTIPDELYTGCTKLELLYLWGNRLTGTISSKIGNLANLQRLALGRNRLSGHVPQELLTNCTRLEVCALEGNSGLHGTLPTDMCARLPHLSQLVLGNVLLQGTIPDSIGDCKQLQVLMLSNGGGLTGSLPPSLGRLPQLLALLVGGNQLTSTLAPELGNLQELRVLSVAGNRISGSIPPSLQRLSQLQTLSLTANELIGSLPESLARLTNLTHLDTSHNQGLWGTLPDLSNAAKLTYLSVRSASLSGRLPPWAAQAAQLPALASACFDNNLFSCEVPAEWLAPSAFPAIARSTAAQRAQGVPLGGCPDPNDPGGRAALLAVSDTSVACPLAPNSGSPSAVTTKDVGAASFQCVEPSLASPFNVAAVAACTLCMAAAVAAVNTGACCRCTKRTRHQTTTPLLGVTSGAGADAVRADVVARLIQETRLAAVIASVVAAAACAAVVMAVRAPASLRCRGSLGGSLIGVRYDLPGWWDGDDFVVSGVATSDSTRGPDSAEVGGNAHVRLGATWLALPASVGVAAVCAWAISAATPALTASHGPPARVGSSAGVEATTAVPRQPAWRLWCKVFAALVTGVLLSAVPNAVFVAMQASTTVSPEWKTLGHRAMSVIKAVLNAVVLPRTAVWATHPHLGSKAAGRPSVAVAGSPTALLWLSLTLRVANKVVIPVVVVLLLDPRCLAGFMPWHQRVHVTSIIDVPYCSQCYSNKTTDRCLLPLSQHCWRWSTESYTEEVEVPPHFSPSCGSAVVEQYGSVVLLAVLLQATVLVALQVVRQRAAMWVRVQVHNGATGQSLPGRVGLLWVASSPRCGARCCRWAASRVVSPWHASRLQSIWTGVVAAVAVAVAWGTVYPPVAMASCLWVWTTWWSRRALLRADHRELRRVEAVLGGNTEKRVLGELRLPPRFGRDQPVGDEDDAARPAAYDGASVRVRRHGEEGNLNNSDRLSAMAPARHTAAAAAWLGNWLVRLVPVVLGCIAHALFFSATGAFAGTSLAWGGTVLPAGAAVLGAGCAGAWARARGSASRGYGRAASEQRTGSWLGLPARAGAESGS